MTDLERALRAAAATAAAETVVPPFARLERRHAVRRVRRAALAGAAVVTLGGIATAVPGGLHRIVATPTSASPTPSGGEHYPKEAGRLREYDEELAAVTHCLETYGQRMPADGPPRPGYDHEALLTPGFAYAFDRCLHGAGFGTFAVREATALEERNRHLAQCDTVLPDATTVASGESVHGPWRVESAAYGSMACVRVTYDGKPKVTYFNAWPTPGQPRGYASVKGRPEVLVYGFRTDDVTRVEVEVAGHSVPATLVPLPGMTGTLFVALVHRDAREAGEISMRFFDATGEITREHTILLVRD